jgi:hypothetical protein
VAWSATNESQKLPAVPKYSIPRIRSKQAAMRTWLLEDLQAFGKVFQGALLEDFRRLILSVICFPENSLEVSGRRNNERIEESVDSLLRVLLGRTIDNDFIETLSLQLVEWIPRFAEGKEYVAWDQREKIWALVFVMDIERKLAKEGRHYMCRFQSLAGLSAGMTWEAHMSGGQIQRLLREIGLPKYQKYSDQEIGGMYMMTYLRPDVRRINIGEVGATASILTFNKKLYKKRLEKCSGGFWTGPCMNCPWGRSDCELARHLHSYVEMIECTNYRIEDGKKIRHRGYKICRDQGVCLDCLNKGGIRHEALKAHYQKKSKFKPGKSLLGGN